MKVICGKCKQEYEIKEAGTNVIGKSKLDLTPYEVMYVDGEKKGKVVCKECRTTNIYTIK